MLGYKQLLTLVNGANQAVDSVPTARSKMDKDFASKFMKEAALTSCP